MLTHKHAMTAAHFHYAQALHFNRISSLARMRLTSVCNLHNKDIYFAVNATLAFVTKHVISRAKRTSSKNDTPVYSKHAYHNSIFICVYYGYFDK